MTSLYFVRHAEPDHDWEDDRTRPLTDEGQADTAKVTEYLHGVRVDAFISSPYHRSYDTVKGAAGDKSMEIETIIEAMIPLRARRATRAWKLRLTSGLGNAKTGL